jgi:hypothetical protein
MQAMKKEPEDRNKLKIASFRTTDGDWFDFSQVAESNGLTATDVLKACMVEYQAGIYMPVINTPVSMRIQSAQGLTAEKVQELISMAISTLSVQKTDELTIDRVTEIARSEVELVTAPIFDDLLNLQSQLAEVKNDCDLTTEGIQRLIDNAIAKMSIGTNPKASKPAPDNDWMSISTFAKKHGLDIAKGTPAAHVRAVLVEKGLDSDWQYDARNGRFNPIEHVNTANS